MNIAPETLARLKTAMGANGFSEDPPEIAPHLVEWRGQYRGHTPLLLKPRTTQEVSAALAICHATGTPVVPQGGNTELVGGQIPMHGEILLSLARLDTIRRIDSNDMSVIAEAGVVLANLQKAADDAECFFPLSLAAEGSCTIGGNLATNAGGVNVLRYGTARAQVLGLEVVLADGRVLDLLRTLRKDNTGYDLKQIFIGAEGTLGIITAAALRLYQKPAQHVTAFLAVPDPAAAIALLRRLQDATGGLVSAFELIARQGLELVLAHIPGTRHPLAALSPWYVLTEIAGGREMQLPEIAERALAAAQEDGLVGDAVIASSAAQRAALWHLRESLSEAQKLEGASVKHDVSVPIDRIPEFIARGIAAVAALVPGIRPVPFGHLGDGNLHFNFSIPCDGDAGTFCAHQADITRAVHDLVRDFGGSISAEHGIGAMKREEILCHRNALDTDLMRSLKAAFDPLGILNPGKMI